MPNVFDRLYIQCKDDSFWKCTFEQNPPFEMVETDEAIRIGNATVPTDLPDDELLQKVQHLLQNTIMQATSHSERRTFDSWRNVKRKSTRQMMILSYLAEHGRHLSCRDITAIYKLLLTGINLRLIGCNDIEIYPGTCRIKEIRNLNLHSKRPFKMHIKTSVPDPSLKPNASTGGVLFK